MVAADLQTPEAGSGSREGRPAAIDARWLTFEMEGPTARVGWIAELEGSVDRNALLGALAARLSALPRFRQVSSHVTGLRPGWADDPSFDLRRHVRHVALPSPGDEETLRHVVETLWAYPLPPDRPFWELHLIDGVAGGRSVILCKLHPRIVDGESALGLLERIADPLPGPEDAASSANRRALEVRPDERRSASVGRQRLVDRLLALAETGAAIGRARDLALVLSSLVSGAREPVTELPFHGRLGRGRRMVWRSFPLDEFQSMSAANDCTIEEAVLAVVAGALRSYLVGVGMRLDTVRVRALVSMRASDSAGGEDSLAWLPVQVADPIERVRRVRDEVRSKGREVSPTGESIDRLGALPSAIRASMHGLLPRASQVSIACTHAGGPGRPIRLLGRRVLEVHAIADLVRDVGLALAVASHTGRLSICASADPALLPDGERVLDAIEAALYELRTAHWQRSEALRLAMHLADQPRVGDLMVRDLATVGPGTSLRHARDVMRRRRVRHVPVVDEQRRVVRVLTQSDLLFSPGSASVAGAPERDATAGPPPVVPCSVEPQDSALAAAQRMVMHRLDALPVLDNRGRLLGLFTEEVLLRRTMEPAGRTARPRAAAPDGTRRHLA